MKPNKKHLLIAAIIGVGLNSAAFAGNTYNLRGDAPSGTKLQPVYAKAALPFDKRYFELTDEQRAQFRARFDSISASQVPPFPRNGLQDLYKPLIDANEKGESGVLQLNVVVNAQGQVEATTVVNAPSKQLAEASVVALRGMEFDPGYCAGEPCEMTFPVQINYR